MLAYCSAMLRQDFYYRVHVRSAREMMLQASTANATLPSMKAALRERLKKDKQWRRFKGHFLRDLHADKQHEACKRRAAGGLHGPHGELDEHTGWNTMHGAHTHGLAGPS